MMLDEKQQIHIVPVEHIVPLPFNMTRIGHEEENMLRDEMTRIESRGLYRIDPVLLRRLTPEEIAQIKAKQPWSQAKYMLIDGHTRWRAARELGWSNIRAIIMDCTVEEAYAIGYIKNKARGTIDPLKEAGYFRYLHEVKRMTADQIAEKFGITSRRVYQILSRTKGAEPLKKIFYETGFTNVVRYEKPEPWHYELLGSIKEPQKQEQLAKIIIEQKLNREEAQIVKEAVEKGLPQETVDRVIAAAKGEKLALKKAKKVVQAAVVEPKIVERITMSPAEETFEERPAEPQLLKTEDEFEETKEQKTGEPVFEIITCPKCGTKAKVEWGAKKITWG